VSATDTPFQLLDDVFALRAEASALANSSSEDTGLAHREEVFLLLTDPRLFLDRDVGEGQLAGRRTVAIAVSGRRGLPEQQPEVLDLFHEELDEPLPLGCAGRVA
jgi:hypothetical protein